MKLASYEYDVQTANVGEVRAFEIASSAHGFRILIDKLYANKIEAPIRELWTNALDSHVAAGTPDTPFVTTLPTQFEPVFKVRDYGVGLNDDQVHKLYATIFSSSKQDTNDQVGAFGLGSKSPFAYTDGFSIACYDGSTVRHYSAFIDAGGAPRIAKMGEETCDEARGVEVSFPVRSDDIGRFITAARRVYFGFKVKPSICGVPEEEIAGLVEILTDKGDWQLYKTVGYSAPLSGMYARQGCVLYPINMNSVDESRTPPLVYNSSAPAPVSGPFIIDFAIGTLDVTPSREGLEYTLKTADAVWDRCEQLRKEYVAELAKEIEGCTTLWEATFKYHHVILAAMSHNSLVTGDNMPTYRGKTLTRYNYIADVAKKANAGRDNAITLKMAEKDRLSRLADPSRAFREGNKITMGKTKIYVHDTTRDKRLPRLAARLYSHWSQTDRDGGALLITGDPKSSSFARLMVILGRPSYTVVNDLPDVQRPRVVGERAPVKLRRLNSRNGFDDVEVDFSDESAYFMKAERGEVKWMGVGESAGVTLFNALKKVGEIDDDANLYIVPKTHWSRLEKSDWISLPGLVRVVVGGLDRDVLGSALYLQRVLKSYRGMAEILPTGFVYNTGHALPTFLQLFGSFDEHEIKPSFRPVTTAAKKLKKFLTSLEADATTWELAKIVQDYRTIQESLGIKSDKSEAETLAQSFGRELNAIEQADDSLFMEMVKAFSGERLINHRDKIALYIAK